MAEASSVATVTQMIGFDGFLSSPLSCLAVCLLSANHGTKVKHEESAKLSFLDSFSPTTGEKKEKRTG